MILVLCAAAGCGDDATGIDASIDGGIGQVELGTGIDAFEPLSDELVLFAGPQGGHHFIVHARIAGFLPGDPTMAGSVDNPSTTFAAFSSDDRQIDLMLPPFRLGYVEQTDGTFDLGAGRILQVDEAVVPALYGDRVTITVQVVDAGGTHGEDSFTGTVVEGPPPPI